MVLEPSDQTLKNVGCFIHRVVTLVAWACQRLVAGRWFPSCFLLFSLFLNEKTPWAEI